MESVPSNRHQIGMAKAVNVIPFPTAKIFTGAFEQCNCSGYVSIEPSLVSNLNRPTVLENSKLFFFSFDLYLRRLFAVTRLVRRIAILFRLQTKRVGDPLVLGLDQAVGGPDQAAKQREQY